MPKRGEIREDGRVFMTVKRGKEYWATPEVFERERLAGLQYYQKHSERIKLSAKSRWNAIKDDETIKAAACEKSKKWRAENPERMRIAITDWEKRNPEKVKQSKRKWVESNPEKVKEIRISTESRRRSRKAQADDGVSLANMREIKAAAKGRCHYCGKKTPKLQFDHIEPIAKGGRHCKSNLVMACMICNATKNDSHPHEYAQRVGRLLI